MTPITVSCSMVSLLLIQTVLLIVQTGQDYDLLGQCQGLNWGLLPLPLKSDDGPELQTLNTEGFRVWGLLFMETLICGCIQLMLLLSAAVLQDAPTCESRKWTSPFVKKGIR